MAGKVQLPQAKQQPSSANTCDLTVPETTYNPSITVDTGLYCPVCRGAIQANLTDSSVGPIVWDVFCAETDSGSETAHKNLNEEWFELLTEFMENAPRNLSYSWAREAWDNYHKEKANVQA